MAKRQGRLTYVVASLATSRRAVITYENGQAALPLDLNSGIASEVTAKKSGPATVRSCHFRAGGSVRRQDHAATAGAAALVAALGVFGLIRGPQPLG